MTTTQRIDCTSIKELGWRQGSILPPDLTARLLEDCDPTEEILVVISHDCDVTNPILDNEPMVELLHAKLVGTYGDGALLHGKHPRRVHFELQAGRKTVFAEANAHDRFFVEREILLQCTPDNVRQCSRFSAEQISNWLSRRYVRSAFPDTFNDRIRPAQRHIKKALSSQGQDITGLFVMMENWNELPGNEPYRIAVVAIMTKEHYDDPNKRQHAQKPVDKIEQRLEKCDGIEVVESSLASEGDVSLADYRLMKRFDFDYLSFQDEPGDIAPRP